MTDKGNELLTESVDALSLDEALLLARELPHLGKLMRGELDGLAPSTARTLARRVLNIAQGHPKLLELADSLAADPARLTRLIQSGDTAWLAAGGLPDGFFATGHASATPGDYLRVLTAWTRTVADTLTDGERDLFWYLCCLEEPDRERSVLDANWDSLWSRLGRAGAPPSLDDTLASVAAHSLAAIRHSSPESYAVHPGVAAAGREQAGKSFRSAADAEIALYWVNVFRSASADNGGGSTATGLLIRAGFAAVPYLLRWQEWDYAAALLDRAFKRDPSRANAAAALPAIRHITDRAPRQAVVLARFLEWIDPAAAESLLRPYLDEATAHRDYEAASAAASQLINLCQASGRLPEALAFADKLPDYIRQAGLDLWVQVDGQIKRLEVLNAMGQSGQVLAEVHRLRSRLPDLPDTRRPDETVQVPPWEVHERLLNTGGHAASLVGRWNDALALNAERIASMRKRGAPDAVIARARFNDYGPLLELGRTDQALHLLQECRQIFYTHDIKGLGGVLSALGDTEYKRGHGDAAIELEREALRFHYLSGDVTSAADGYQRLGSYLHLHARQAVPALASHLAAALIRTLTSARDADKSVRAAAADLWAFGDAAVPPADIASLARQIGDIPGADLKQLIAAITLDLDAANQALRDLIAQAQAKATASTPGNSPDNID